MKRITVVDSSGSSGVAVLLIFLRNSIEARHHLSSPPKKAPTVVVWPLKFTSFLLPPSMAADASDWC